MTDVGASPAQPSEIEIAVGTAGASAQREFERRKANRERRTRDAHPHLGGLILALSDVPQSTTAWQTGARGEAIVGRQLDRRTERGIHVLHDRRIPGTKANIDHLVIGPRGVFVIDAKRFKGRPRLRVEGGFLSPKTEKLMVGSRNCTGLVNGVRKQVRMVQTAVDASRSCGIPVFGMICFVEAEWPLVGGNFAIGGVDVLWPKKAVAFASRPGPVDANSALAAFRTLAQQFPPA